MTFIIYLIVTAAIVFVPYYIGKLANKVIPLTNDWYGYWYIGLMYCFMLSGVVTFIIITSNGVINLIK